MSRFSQLESYWEDQQRMSEIQMGSSEQKDQAALDYQASQASVHDAEACVRNSVKQLDESYAYVEADYRGKCRHCGEDIMKGDETTLDLPEKRRNGQPVQVLLHHACLFGFMDADARRHAKMQRLR